MSDVSVKLVVVSTEELREMIEHAVRDGAANLRASADWMTIAEVADALDVKPDTVRKLCARDGLPHRRPGRGYVFRREEVMAWLEERSTSPRSHGAKHGRRLRALRGGGRG